MRTLQKWRRNMISMLTIGVVVAHISPPCIAAEPALTSGGREAAALLGIQTKVDRLMELNRLHGGVQQDSMNDEELALKVDILDRVMTGILETRVVADRIDKELSWAFSGQGMLAGRRQRNLNRLFTANFMQGGTLGTLSGPMFLHGLPKVGTELLLLGSSIGLGLSTIAFVEARSGSKKIDGGTTVLADVFHINQIPPEHQTEIVTRYLESVPPGAVDSKTRIQILMDGWSRKHTLGSTDENHLARLAAYEPQVETERENIALITSRIRMLFDTQWTVEQLDADMLDILRATSVN